MCKDQQPLSTVRFLADALSLSPIANPPPSETTQPENERTPEEIALFKRIYLSLLARTTLSITEQDREELRRRGLPRISEDALATARERHAQLLRARLEAVLRTQPRTQQPLHTLPMRLNHDPVTPHAPNPGLPSQNLGTQAFERPTLEDTFPSLRPEIRASGLGNANGAGATDAVAGRRAVFDVERYQWGMTLEELQALMMEFVRRRRGDEERGGGGGAGG